MKLAEIGEYITQLNSNSGGAYFSIGEQEHVVALRPLKFLQVSKELVVDKLDIKFVENELTSKLRVIPRVLFTSSDVYFYSKGLIIVNGMACGRTLRNIKFSKGYIDNIKLKEENIVVERIEGCPPLLLGPLETFNYSHWIFEGIPKINQYKSVYNSLPQNIVMFGNLKRFHFETIDFFSPGAIIKAVQEPSIFPQKVAYTTSLAKSVNEIDPSVFEFYGKILLTKYRYNKSSKRRIYISRNKAKHRRILNEDSLIDKLKCLSFEVVTLEELSFSEQVDLFWNASVVVSAHGAGLANLVFARNCGLLLEIFSSGFRDKSAYAHVCRHLGIKYLAASGTPVQQAVRDKSDPEGWEGHKSFDAPVEKISLVLTSLLGNQK